MASKDLGTIMIIEDNEQDYNMLVRAFKEVGIENPITYHDNGDDALEFLADKNAEMPSYIFLDLNMPGIDGRDVLSKIKGAPRSAEIPVIVITSSSKKSDIEECYEDGADNYIMKPMGFEGYINEAKMIHSFINNPGMRI